MSSKTYILKILLHFTSKKQERPINISQVFTYFILIKSIKMCLIHLYAYFYLDRHTNNRCLSRGLHFQRVI